jgi:hypothetical protein
MKNWRVEKKQDVKFYIENICMASNTKEFDYLVSSIKRYLAKRRCARRCMLIMNPRTFEEAIIHWYELDEFKEFLNTLDKHFWLLKDTVSDMPCLEDCSCKHRGLYFSAN